MTRVPVPRWWIYTAAIAVVVSWLPLVFIARARAVKSTRPRVHIIQDMDQQAKFPPQAIDRVFADQRAMRP